MTDSPSDVPRDLSAELNEVQEARSARRDARHERATMDPYIEPDPDPKDPNMITEADVAFFEAMDEARGLTAEVKAEYERDFYRPAHLRRYDHDTPDSDMPDDFEVVMPDGRKIIVYGSFHDPEMLGPSVKPPTTTDQPDGPDGNEGEASDGRA